MLIEAGDRFPDATVWTMEDGRIRSQDVKDLLAGRTAVLFGVPGVFTSTCSEEHLPGYIARASDFRDAGVDFVGCVAVNDAEAMEAWRRAYHAGEHVKMLADGNADLVTAMGAEMDSRAFGMGTRSRRWAAVVEDGTVRDIWVEENPGAVTVSSAESVLAALRP